MPICGLKFIFGISALGVSFGLSSDLSFAGGDENVEFVWSNETNFCKLKGYKLNLFSRVVILMIES